MTTLRDIMGSRLGLEVGEDPMEISSELEQKIVIEEDIDIDLDLIDDRSEDGEDEYMIEDVDFVVDQDGLGDDELHPSNDDEMADDAHTPHLEEDVTSVSDEDLVDADEDNLDLNASASVITTTADPEQVGTEDSDQYKQNPTFQGAEDITDYSEEHRPFSSVNSSGGTEFHHPQNPEPETDDDGTHKLSVPSHESNGPDGNDVQTDTDDVSNSKNSDNLDNHLVGEPENLLLDVQTLLEPSVSKNLESDHEPLLQTSTLVHTSQAENGDTGSHQSTPLGESAKSISHSDDVAFGSIQLNQVSYVHSVIVVYQHNQISLFPPIEQNADQAETYFLSDPSLAGESIIELLKACRIVLAESINDEDELEIKIDSLNLDFCECTAESSTTSLAQILELYLQLKQNDGVDDPDPLFMTLTTKMKLANRLEYLYTAVAEGKGFADVVQLQASDTTEDGEDYDGASKASNYEDGIGIAGDEASQAHRGIKGSGSAEVDQGDRMFAQSPSNNLRRNEDIPATNRVTTDGGRSESEISQTKTSENKQNEATSGENTEEDRSPFHSTYSQTSENLGKHQHSKDGGEADNSVGEPYHEIEEHKHAFGENDVGSGPQNGTVTSTRISQEVSLPMKHFDSIGANAVNSAQPTVHAEIGELEDEDSIDYEEDERINGSSAATSTVRGDDSEVLIGNDGRVLSESNNHPTALDDEEARPRHESPNFQATTSNLGVDNENGFSNSEDRRIHEVKDEKANIEDAELIISAITKQLLVPKEEHTRTLAGVSELPSKDIPAYDDDEITYDDEEEEAENKSNTSRTLVNTNEIHHGLAEASVSGDLSLKRPRTDLDGGDTSGNGLQGADLKRFRSY